VLEIRIAAAKIKLNPCFTFFKKSTPYQMYLKLHYLKPNMQFLKINLTHFNELINKILLIIAKIYKKFNL